MGIDRVEVARIAVRLIPKDAESVKRMTGQACSKIYQYHRYHSISKRTHRYVHHEYGETELSEGMTIGDGGYLNPR